LEQQRIVAYHAYITVTGGVVASTASSSWSGCGSVEGLCIFPVIAVVRGLAPSFSIVQIRENTDKPQQTMASGKSPERVGGSTFWQTAAATDKCDAVPSKRLREDAPDVDPPHTTAKIPRERSREHSLAHDSFT